MFFIDYVYIDDDVFFACGPAVGGVLLIDFLFAVVLPLPSQLTLGVAGVDLAGGNPTIATTPTRMVYKRTEK